MPVTTPQNLSLSLPIAPSSNAYSGASAGSDAAELSGVGPTVYFGDKNGGAGGGDTWLTPLVRDAVIAVVTALVARYLWEQMN